MAKGRELQAQGKYLESVEILNKLVFAEPRNQPARDLLADAYEQLGYQMESTSLRNSFLQGTLRTAFGHAHRHGAEHRQRRRDPLHAHRVLAGLPRHQHGPEAGGGDEPQLSTS